MKLEKISEYGDFDNYKDNLIIHGDCFDVLSILTTQYTNKIKCIYIDPPYNNGEVFTHYNDNKDRTLWLKDLKRVLVLLKNMLTDDGSLWISIDDGNMHYLKCMADEVFTYDNFVGTIIWQHRTTRENRSIFSFNHEYILLYTKNKQSFKKSRHKIESKGEILSRYKNPDNDPRGPWQSVTAHVQDGHAAKSQFYEITAPNGKIHKLPNGRCWIYNQQKMKNEIKSNNIWFGEKGNGVPRIKSFLKKDTNYVTPETIWTADEVGTTDKAKKHILQLFKNRKVFDTPKPEELIKRILEISTNENDIILDAFLGSGTTCATAHKMKRKYIGIEKEDNTIKYILERMEKVINGEKGGISKEVNWKSGGHFTFLKIKK